MLQINFGFDSASVEASFILSLKRYSDVTFLDELRLKSWQFRFVILDLTNIEVVRRHRSSPVKAVSC